MDKHRNTCSQKWLNIKKSDQTNECLTAFLMFSINFNNFYSQQVHYRLMVGFEPFHQQGHPNNP